MAHTVYIRFTVFSNFSKLQFVFHISTFRNFYSGDAHHTNYGKHSLNHHFGHGAHGVYKIYSVFKLFEIAVCSAHFDFFSIFYSGNVHHANSGKHSLNHHFRDAAHSVYRIYSVFKLFEIAVCFSHFDFFEISTPAIRIILTMANIV